MTPRTPLTCSQGNGVHRRKSERVGRPPRQNVGSYHEVCPVALYEVSVLVLCIVACTFSRIDKRPGLQRLGASASSWRKGLIVSVKVHHLPWLFGQFIHTFSATTVAFRKSRKNLCTCDLMMTKALEPNGGIASHKAHECCSEYWVAMNTLPGLRAGKEHAPVLRPYIQVPLRLIIVGAPPST